MYDSEVIKTVVFTEKLQKELRAVPIVILKKLRAWVDDVETNGLENARRRPGYHDEPLQGDRRGERSVRLNRSWRAIYVIGAAGDVECVEVHEVNKHDY